jgi:hypothetical protein
MMVKSRRSFLGCGCTGMLSSGSHRAGWVDAVDAWDWPLFVSNGTSHSSGGKKANVFSPPLINLGTCFEPSLWLSCWHK